MKNIKIKFYGLGFNDINQAKVFIYDLFGNIIYEGITYNNEINICIKEKDIYRIIAISSCSKIINNFYVGNNDYYCFSFYRIIKNTPITFLLTDYYYNNLPIEKGELILNG